VIFRLHMKSGIDVSKKNDQELSQTDSGSTISSPLPVFGSQKPLIAVLQERCWGKTAALDCCGLPANVPMDSEASEPSIL
jgi:hypothetical protein